MQPMTQQLHSYLCKQNSHGAQTRTRQGCCGGRDQRLREQPGAHDHLVRREENEVDANQVLVATGRATTRMHIKQEMSTRAKIDFQGMRRKQQHICNHIMVPRKANTSENIHGTHQSGSTEVHDMGRGR